jgi:GNAT superfamily N-acetyltransferase
MLIGDQVPRPARDVPSGVGARDDIVHDRAAKRITVDLRLLAWLTPELYLTIGAAASRRQRIRFASIVPMEWRRDGYLISTDPVRLDREAIWRFLRTTYWSSDVARDVVERSIENSLAFGLYSPQGTQAGFARVVTDRARFAWLSDVFVLEEHRGIGLGVWLVGTTLSHPELSAVRFVLGTADAHGLYERFGFEPADPGRLMDRKKR